MYSTLGILYLLLCPYISQAEVGETDLNKISEQQNLVKINKCCESNELIIDSVCRLAEQYNQSTWIPQFRTEDGKDANVKNFRFIHGLLDCKITRRQVIYDIQKSEDELNLLTDGRVLHLIHHEQSTDSNEEIAVSNIFSLHDSISIPEEKEPISFIYQQDKYCMDKVFVTNKNLTGLYALVCVPEVKIN